jgi:hypothetical protein
MRTGGPRSGKLATTAYNSVTPSLMIVIRT